MNAVRFKTRRRLWRFCGRNCTKNSGQSRTRRAHLRGVVWLVLAIAAKKIGCARVDAFDIDPDTIPIAQENAEINGINTQGILFRTASLLEYQSDIQYDLVAANILSSALIAGRDKLLSFCHPGTKLMLAGILDSEYTTVKNAFESSGRCRELFSAQEKEWRGGAFEITE